MGEGLKKLGRGARTTEGGRGLTGSHPGPWRDDKGAGSGATLQRRRKVLLRLFRGGSVGAISRKLWISRIIFELIEVLLSNRDPLYY
jgi:hypothetical protein